MKNLNIEEIHLENYVLNRKQEYSLRNNFTPICLTWIAQHHYIAELS